MTNLKRLQDELERTIKYTEESLHDAKQTICNLQQENDDLKQSSEQMKKQIEILKKQSEIGEPLLDLNRLTSDRDITFYTGFPNYNIFLALFNYLNPGTNGENIRYVREKPVDIYREAQCFEFRGKTKLSFEGKQNYFPSVLLYSDEIKIKNIFIQQLYFVIKTIQSKRF